MLLISLRTILRNFRRQPSFSLLNMAGLCIGVTGCILLLLYVRYDWGFDKQIQGAKDIYVVYSNQSSSGKVFSFAVSPAPLAAAAEKEIPGVVRAVRVTDVQDGLLSVGEKVVKQPGMYADKAFFQLFDYSFIKGDPASVLQDPHAIVLTAKTAALLFGAEDPMDKVIRLNNKDNVVVRGVLADLPANETNQFAYVMPWSLYQQNNAWLNNPDWSSNVCMTYVQLSGKTAFGKADALFRKMLANRIDQASGHKAEAFLYPLSRYHLYGEFQDGKPTGGGEITQVRLLTLLAFAILLIACINFMNLSTARSETKAKEVGIRKTIGSSRKALVRFFLLESLLYAACATLLSALLLEFSLPWFNTLLGLSIASPLGDAGYWMALAGLWMVTGLVAGSYPSLYLSSFKPLKALKGSVKTGKGALQFRKVLVVSQFVLTVFLLVATAGIYAQLNYIHHKPIGYDKTHLLEVPLEGELAKNPDVLKNELLSSGYAVSTCFLSQSLTNIYFSGWSITWPGEGSDQKVLFNYYGAGYDFVKTTGVEITKGRDFSPDFPSDSTGVLLSESAAREMSLPQPIGTIIHWGNQPMTIVGIFKDFVSGSPYYKQRPMAVYLSPASGNVAAIKLAPGKSLGDAVQKINGILKTLNPAYPPVVNFVDQDFAQKFKSEERLGILSRLFGGLAIFVSCLGLFGLSAFAAEQRKKEIGIRKVLGANVLGLIRLLSTDYVKLLGLACLVAFPAAWWGMHAWLQNFEYRVGISWWLFGLAGAVTSVVALVTVNIVFFRAAVSNPVKSLRTE